MQHHIKRKRIRWTHRFKIALTLAKKEITTTDDDNFVDLLKIQDGVVESKVEKTDYNILEDTLS